MVEDAKALVAAFPESTVEGTELPAYLSPHLPFGRGVEGALDRG